jgi:hypothetical protein
MDPLVVEAFAQLGDQHKQQLALAGDRSLRSLSQALVASAGEETPEANELLVVREREVG